MHTTCTQRDVRCGVRTRQRSPGSGDLRTAWAHARRGTRTALRWEAVHPQQRWWVHGLSSALDAVQRCAHDERIPHGVSETLLLMHGSTDARLGGPPRTQPCGDGALRAADGRPCGARGHGSVPLPFGPGACAFMRAGQWAVGGGSPFGHTRCTRRHSHLGISASDGVYAEGGIPPVRLGASVRAVWWAADTRQLRVYRGASQHMVALGVCSRCGTHRLTDDTTRPAQPCHGWRAVHVARRGSMR